MERVGDRRHQGRLALGDEASDRLGGRRGARWKDRRLPIVNQLDDDAEAPRQIEEPFPRLAVDRAVEIGWLHGRTLYRLTRARRPLLLRASAAAGWRRARERRPSRAVARSRWSRSPRPRPATNQCAAES